MTERLGSLPVVTAAGALFCVALVYLALQMRAGADPAIGAGSKTDAAPARPVIVRRVIVRRIVEEAPTGSAAPAAPAASGAPAVSAAPAAPAASGAPAVSAAPAAPAAPAPVTTQAS